MRDALEGQGVRDGGGGEAQEIPSSVPRSAGITVDDCEVSVHLKDADCTDGDDGDRPYQAGDGYVVQQHDYGTRPSLGLFISSTNA